MNMHAEPRRVERRKTLAQQPGNHAGEHITAAAGGHAWVVALLDPSLGNVAAYRPMALKHNDGLVGRVSLRERTGCLGTALHLVSLTGKARFLSAMRRQYALPT